jgi:hypothetical protein
MSGSILSGIKAMPHIQNAFIEIDSFHADSFCRAQLNPAVSQHILSNSVPPEEVKIVGEKSVRADRSVVFRCLANNANPAPVIEWTVNGQPVTAGINTFTHPPPSAALRRRAGAGDEPSRCLSDQKLQILV